VTCVILNLLELRVGVGLGVTVWLTSDQCNRTLVNIVSVQHTTWDNPIAAIVEIFVYHCQCTQSHADDNQQSIGVQVLVLIGGIILIYCMCCDLCRTEPVNGGHRQTSEDEVSQLVADCVLYSLTVMF
jgi:hypothetical protein